MNSTSITITNNKTHEMKIEITFTDVIINRHTV